MRHVDVAIAGGGLAGSTAAAMLARAGLDVALVDPHPVYPFDFRSEKLSAQQVHLLRRTGLADAVLSAATAMDEIWIARFGRLIERRRNPARGEGANTTTSAADDSPQLRHTSHKMIRPIRLP
jgi:2-polyprenyl-6-methoxyphenol hydroxylase-like FAD-dependent oxidoreductase